MGRADRMKLQRVDGKRGRSISARSVVSLARVAMDLRRDLRCFGGIRGSVGVFVVEVASF